MTKLIRFALACLAALALNTPVNAQVPINQNLAEALKALPVPGISSVATQLLAGLTPIKGGYTAKTVVSGTPVMLYLYGSSSVSQTMFLVVGGNIALPNVFNNSTWRRIAGSSVNDAIFSLATIDFSLKTEDMNDDLRNMVWKGHYLGTQPSDVMMHVPVDEHLAKANDKVRPLRLYSAPKAGGHA